MPTAHSVCKFLSNSYQSPGDTKDVAQNVRAHVDNSMKNDISYTEPQVCFLVIHSFALV